MRASIGIVHGLQIQIILTENYWLISWGIKIDEIPEVRQTPRNLALTEKMSNNIDRIY